MKLFDNIKGTTDKTKLKEEMSKVKIQFVLFIKRLFYTLMFGMFCYALILIFCITIPSVLGYLIGSFGYTLGSTVEVYLSSCVGLFFIAWMFFISYKIVMFVWNIYITKLNSIKH